MKIECLARGLALEVVAVGVKEHNRLRIGSEEVEFSASQTYDLRVAQFAHDGATNKSLRPKNGSSGR